MDKIIVLDFGSQYSHLICRRIREFNVYANLLSYNTPIDEIKKLNPKGIIFTGGPSSVYDKEPPSPDNHIFNSNIPILGICYGHQLIVNNFGGEIKKANKEYGSSTLMIDDDLDLFNNIGRSINAWMSHGDEAKKVPKEFTVIGHTDHVNAAAIVNKNRTIYGIQFHPEVIHTENGNSILQNFVLKICKAKQEWIVEKFINKTIDRISKIDGDVVCGVSGGIDSTVTALLINKAIKNRVKCVFIDNGLLRINERETIKHMFESFSIKLIIIDAQKRFLSKLIGISDPELKRKIIGEEFAKIFLNFIKSNKSIKWLAQGTLYPDVIESGVSKGPASVIKTHHNVGGLPKWLKIKLLEPIRDLYKDEVRKIANKLDVPQELIYRHPFPGPGLAVRIIGKVTEKKLKITKLASKIVEEELENAKLLDKVWQAYAMVGDDKAVGITGDKRKIGYIVTVKIVESVDAMTANWVRLPYKILEKISNRITNEIEEATWVSYSISNKPPSTIEPQ